jgi:hypothetical protein
MSDDQTIYARIRRNSNWADAGEILMFPPNIPDIKCLNDKNILSVVYCDIYMLYYLVFEMNDLKQASAIYVEAM